MLETLHSRANHIADGWRITRLRFFLYVTAAGFIWYFFPGLMFTALSYFTWVCWITPKNVIVNQLFGMQAGLGLSPITFDWKSNRLQYKPTPVTIMSGVERVLPIRFLLLDCRAGALLYECLVHRIPPAHDE